MSIKFAFVADEALSLTLRILTNMEQKQVPLSQLHFLLPNERLPL